VDILGDRKFIELPGSKPHELPPLLVRTSPAPKRLDRVVDMAADIVESEDIIPHGTIDDPKLEASLEGRRMDLALTLVDQYMAFLSQWTWGDSILEWIRQCEITFECEDTLRKLLHPDVWPHASRASFVQLLREKHVPTHGVALEKAVGLRLTFRQPPPIDCFSSQFLFYLNSTVAGAAYQTWSHLIPQAPGLFPPERFHFDVVNIGN
jgi:hypothetical protein